MRTFLLLPLLLMFISPIHSQNTKPPQDGSAVVVLSSKWTKSRQVVEILNEPGTSPIRAVIPANRNFERNRRINDPVGVRDPNDDTIDGRSAAIEKNVQEARSPKSKPVNGFAYQIKVRNASAKAIEIVFWEYQFKESANPKNVVRRQFLCGVNINPDKEKEIQSFSMSGPSDVISLESLAGKSGNLFEEKIVINRVEYADGTIWQRKDWNFSEVRASIARALNTPWGREMCRGL